MHISSFQEPITNAMFPIHFLLVLGLQDPYRGIGGSSGAAGESITRAGLVVKLLNGCVLLGDVLQGWGCVVGVTDTQYPCM